jgi:cytochrome c oxidase cbb3-type subunit II
MNDHPKSFKEKILHFIHNIEASAVITFIGILLLFSISIAIILIAPRHIDPTWTSPTTPYQVMMYEISDPHLYISGARKGSNTLEFVQQLKQDFTLLAFKEENLIRILAPAELEHYVTRVDDKVLKLTSRLLLLRRPENLEQADALRKKLQATQDSSQPKLDYTILELYDPQRTELFSVAESEGDLANWVDENFKIIEGTTKQPYHRNYGVIYVKNPQEYKIGRYRQGMEEGWHYDPQGLPVATVAQLKSPSLGFMSRQELIQLGEHLFTVEGCWYCHTDQTRTLVQDVVLNGSESYPAPPSSPNEYIYQKVTFMGTRRIGPDLSRVGVKKPSRDWHKGHFWFPKTASPGTIMPAFRHFFDNDPRGTAVNPYGVPNYKFEAMFQYLMTKGTRITPPTQAWWLGKDPIQTKEIIEGKRKL